MLGSFDKINISILPPLNLEFEFYLGKELSLWGNFQVTKHPLPHCLATHHPIVRLEGSEWLPVHGVFSGVKSTEWGEGGTVSSDLITNEKGEWVLCISHFRFTVTRY